MIGTIAGWFGLAWVKAALVAAAVAAAVAGYFLWADHIGDVREAKVRAEWNAEKLVQQSAALAESQSNARETLRRLERQKESQDALDALTAQNAADRARADAAGVSLRNAAARYAAASRCPASNSASGSISAPADTAPVVLADVLGRIDQTAGELATAFDASRAAGLKCQSDYNALTPP